MTPLPSTTAAVVAAAASLKAIRRLHSHGSRSFAITYAVAGRSASRHLLRPLVV